MPGGLSNVNSLIEIDSDNKEISLKELEEEESKEGVILSVDEIKDEVRARIFKNMLLNIE